MAASVAPRAADTPLGYYRFPALAGDLLVFTAEGDLWKTTVNGGVPERLTAHPGEETDAALSPDAKWVAFTGTYEGPDEAYVLPLDGGPPKRLTWDGGPVAVVSWTPDGKVLCSTRRYSTLPNATLIAIDPVTGVQTAVPLAQASDGVYAADGTLYFTRLPFQGSQTRRYKGGTAQQLWRLAPGAPEAAPVTGDFPGTSKRPMIWKDRLYFLSDRDGTMNLWSMALAGGGLTQHTRHADYEAQGASLSAGRIAYQHGADIRVYDIAANTDRVVPIRLVSDFDQVRERWVTTPFDWVTAAHLSPTGDRVVLTARGQLFVVPVEQGRLVEATRNPKVRYRNGRFMPDGKSLLGLSDESGEVEFWRVPANGLGPSTQVTTDGAVLRWDGLPSPDGKSVAHYDKDQQLWVFDLATKKQTKLAFAGNGDFDDLAWSPDSRFLAYTAPDANTLTRIFLWEAATGRIEPVTSDRYDSVSPAWSRDSKWIYFLSDRNFVSLVGSPWGSRQPEPFYDKQTRVYHVPLVANARSPFQPADELHPAEKKDDEKKDEEKKDKGTKDEGTKDKGTKDEGTKDKATKDDAGRPLQPDDAADGSAGAGRQLQQPVGGCQATLRHRSRHRTAIQARAQDAGHRREQARARDLPRRRPELRAVGRWQEGAGAPREGLPRARRRGQGAGRSRTGQEGAAACELAVPARSAQRVAPDVHRGLASRARLLLRPPDARRGLGRRPREVRAAGRSRHRSGRALRCPGPDGERVVRAAHLRLRRRRADGQRRRRARIARGADGPRRRRRRPPRRTHLCQRSRSAR